MRYILMVVLCFILAGQTPVMAQRQQEDFGIGIIIGEPTGLSMKLWTSHRTAFAGAAAWSYRSESAMHLHMDYLIHNYRHIHVDEGTLPIFFGIGGRLKFTDRDDTHIGVRIPVGLEYLFEDMPLGLFIEVVPLLDLAPATEMTVNGGVGLRVFF